MKWWWRHIRGRRYRFHAVVRCPYCKAAFGLDCVPVVYDP